MDRFFLNSKQSAIPYEPLVDQSEDKPAITRKSWRGRKVSVAERLRDADQGPESATADDLKIRLQARYGHAIQEKVAGRIAGDTPLSDRQVALLEGKARKLLKKNQSANRKHLKNWVKSETSAGFVAKQFQQLTGYRWDSIPAHERRYMVDQVRLVLAQSPEKLTKKDAAYLAGQCLRQHQSMFSQFCPETTGMIQELTDLEPPIMGGHLQEWAIVEQNSEDGDLRDDDMQIIMNFQNLNNRVMGIVSASSLEDTQELSYHEQIEAIKKLSHEIEWCISDIEDYAGQLPLLLCSAMINDLNRNLAAVDDYKQQLIVNAEGDPRRAEQWKKLRLTELRAAREVLNEELGTYGELNEMGGLSEKEQSCSDKLQDRLDELDAKIELIESDNDETEFSKEETRRYPKHVEYFLMSAGIEKSEIAGRMQYYREQQLIKQPWEPIVKKMRVRVNGETHECESVITPAACLQIEFTEGGNGGSDVFTVPYKGTGRPSSVKTEAGHAVNLNETRLMVGGKEAFRGLRSATLCAYGIKDKNDRKAANKVRAKELVVAAVRMQIDDNEAYKNAALNGERVPVKLFSTSLLSPDRFRHVTHIHDDELKMQQEQVAALREVVKEIQEGEGAVTLVESNGDAREVEVDLKLITCNFGVNHISLKPAQRRLMGAWGATEAENIEGLQALFGSTEPGEVIDGWAGECLQEDDLPEHERLIIVELVEQIREMFTSGSYQREGQDAYDMVERLQYLAYKLNAIAHVNCKSGKDRSGEADGANKRFATLVAVNGYVPDPDLPMSREEQILAQQFMLGTGNIELQQQNLNMPGYKTQTGKKVLGDYVYGLTHKPEFDDSVNLHSSDYD